VYPGDLARSQFALARCLDDLHDRTGARAEAERALASYRLGPAFASRSDQVEGWLAARAETP
jgi:hypothetical protein